MNADDNVPNGSNTPSGNIPPIPLNPPTTPHSPESGDAPGSSGHGWLPDHKVQVAVAVIGFLGVAVTALFQYFGGNEDDGNAARSSTPPEVIQTNDASESATPTRAGNSPSDGITVSSTPAIDPQPRAVVYENKSLAISWADWRRGAIDLDVPSVRSFSTEEWSSNSDTIKWDLRYWGTSVTDSAYLEVSNSVSAAELDDSPESAEQCASEAQVGGYTAASLEEWPLHVGNALCLITDRGNVVRLKITKFVGGDSRRGDAPPDRVEFEATMWQGEQP
ncbi:hypothetical protein [Streptomyces ardesiacus]|uniref:hypothetical protein n=1 Tax=Streptomyces ardesiacus TaxID=285564 RepID=UPI0036EAC21F